MNETPQDRPDWAGEMVEIMSERDKRDDGLCRFESGAVRGTDRSGVRWDLLPFRGLRRVAETCAFGAAKYGPDNWRKGIPQEDLLNHAIAHLADWREGDESEDHLAHAAWNLLVMIHNEEAILHSTISIPAPSKPIGTAVRDEAGTITGVEPPPPAPADIEEDSTWLHKNGAVFIQTSQGWALNWPGFPKAAEIVDHYREYSLSETCKRFGIDSRHVWAALDFSKKIGGIETTIGPSGS